MAKKSFFELPSRSLVKAITFRCIILTSDSIIIYLVTHRLDVTLDVMIASNVASTLLFVFHERAWNRISWGKKAK